MGLLEEGERSFRDLFQSKLWNSSSHQQAWARMAFHPTHSGKPAFELIFNLVLALYDDVCAS